MSISAINVRNQFRGKVKEIIRGPVVSEVGRRHAVRYRHVGDHDAFGR